MVVPQHTALGLAAVARLVCVLPVVALLWCSVYWAMG